VAFASQVESVEKVIVPEHLFDGDALFELLEPTFRTPVVEVAYFTACLAN
jgi:hypothetical protein